jgi:hypothetical protein
MNVIGVEEEGIYSVEEIFEATKCRSGRNA